MVILSISNNLISNNFKTRAIIAYLYIQCILYNVCENALIEILYSRVNLYSAEIKAKRNRYLDILFVM